MPHHKRMILLYRLAPFRAWKAGLLHRHIEECPECERLLASREEARRVLVQVRDVGNLDRMWPAIAQKIRGVRPMPAPGAALAREAAAPQPGLAWRAAAAATGLAVAILATIVLVRFLGTASALSETEEGGTGEVQIHYVRIDNEPAQTFIFKPHGSDVVIVWAGRNI